MPDIRIVPGNAIMSFTSSLNFIERITQDPSGSLTLYGSGSTGRTDLFSIDGNNGRLFSVSDDLSDSLFSVNTIAGLPVIEAFANNSVNIGQYSAPPIRVIGSSAFITGSLAGGADFSRTSLVYNEGTNATRYLVFASNGNGTPQTLYTNLGNLTYNPSSNTLTAGTFSGALTGNASTATALTSMNISQFTNNSGYTTNTGTVTSVGGTGTVNGITLTGTVSTTGNLTLGGTLGSIANSQLVNSAIQIGSTNMSLGNGYSDLTGLGTVRAGAGTAGAPSFAFTSDTNTGMYNISADTLGFSTAGTARMVIDSSGRVGVSTTSMVRDFQVGAFSGSPEICIGSGTAGNGTLAFGDGASGNDPWRGYVQYQHTNDRMVFGTANAGWLNLTSGGALGLNIVPTNTAGRFEASNDIVAYSSSDKRWKKNIKNINSPLEKLSQINGVEFDWIEDEPVHGNKGHDIGVIAQEVEQVLPEIVQTRESGMKAVQYDKIIPLLVECIKDQQKQIDELKQIVNGITS